MVSARAPALVAVPLLTLLSIPVAVRAEVADALWFVIAAMILATRVPARLREARDAAVELDLPPHEAERVVFGATHADVGAYLLGLWGLPDATVEAVAYHHDEARALEAGFGALSATHLAERIIETTAPAFEQVDEDRDPPDLESLAEQLGAGAHLESWLAWAKSHAGGAR